MDYIIQLEAIRLIEYATQERSVTAARLRALRQIAQSWRQSTSTDQHLDYTPRTRLSQTTNEVLGPVTERYRSAGWRTVNLLGGAALVLSGIACTSAESGDRLTDVLVNDEVIAELRYDPTVVLGSSQSESVSTVVLNVEEFVSEIVSSEEGWPSWLSIGESTIDSTVGEAEYDAHIALDWLHRYLPAETQEGNGTYVWALYWTLAMPPAQVQLAILEREFGVGELAEQNIAEFRARYPEYLAELARAWLAVNSEHRPGWLRVE
ncbi:hypothetical protein [Candidatus Poriferisodalis sp.]|uniref:hypothetical protein n=1 Tax=Candidatus Poriferisodalis sp. TaxID=3101277 RepID=UPI003B028CD1